MSTYRKVSIEAVIAVDGQADDDVALAYFELMQVMRDIVRQKVSGAQSLHGLVGIDYPVVSLEVTSDDCDAYGKPVLGPE